MSSIRQKISQYLRRKRPQNSPSSQPEPLACHQLPVELWHNIISYLDKHDLKALASTSHYIRSMAVPKLFESLRFQVGYLHAPRGYSRSQKEHKKKLLKVLRRLERPQTLVGQGLIFSDLVQNLFIRGRFQIDEQIKHHLLLALRRLTNLRNFVWYGYEIPEDIAGKLAISCTNLQSSRVERPQFRLLCRCGLRGPHLSGNTIDD